MKYIDTINNIQHSFFVILRIVLGKSQRLFQLFLVNFYIFSAKGFEMAIEFLSLRYVVCVCLTKLHIFSNENCNQYSLQTVNTWYNVNGLCFYDVPVAISSKSSTLFKLVLTNDNFWSILRSYIKYELLSFKYDLCWVDTFSVINVIDTN